MITFIFLLYYILHKKLTVRSLRFFDIDVMIRECNRTELRLDWRGIFKFVFIKQNFVKHIQQVGALITSQPSLHGDL